MADKSHRNSLKPGYRIGPYEIIRILGQGGFGITYLARDINLDRDVAIKEYLPVELAIRDTDTSIYPVSGEHGEQYKWGLERFINEAQTLARFKHPNIVRVLTVLRENNTAYIVMEYEHGRPLHELIKNRKTLEEEELKNILFPILEGLEAIHKAGFIHRDIKPPNIYIREDNSPVLIDFGSARQSLLAYTRTLTTMVSPGYAPFEQYVGKSDKQGPWTDIYGLGATLYRSVTGISPADSMARSEAILHTGRDIYVSASEIAKDKYSPAFLAAIDRAMSFKTDDRPQSIAEWRNIFEGASQPAETLYPGSEDQTIKPEDLEKENTVTGETPRKKPGFLSDLVARLNKIISKMLKWGFLLLVLLIVIGVIKKGTQNQGMQEKGQIMSESSEVVEDLPEVVSELPGETASTATEDIRQLSQEETINTLLQAAEENIKVLRLMTPRGDNALEKYRQVLSLEPGNRDALDGINRIVDEYILLMDNAINRGFLGKAGEFLGKAETVNAGHPSIGPARTRLESALQAASPATITDSPLPSEVDSPGQDQPDTNNAIPAEEQQQLQSIRERLVANPGDKEARKDLKELAKTFEQNIRTAVGNGDYDLARAYVYEIQANTDKNTRAYKRLTELLDKINEKEMQANQR